MHYEEQEYSKRLDLAVWRRLFRFARPYRRSLLLLIGQMVVIGLIDAIFPLFSKYAIDNVALPGRTDRIPVFAAVTLLFIAAQAVNIRVMIKNAGKMECHIPYDIRRAAFEKLQSMELSYFDRTPVGWLMARLTSDCRRLGQTLSWNVVDLFWSLAVMILTAVFMLLLDIRLALLVLAAVPVLILASLVFQKKILFNFRKVRRFNSQVTAGFNEGITGAKTIKSLSVEDELQDEFRQTTDDMRRFAIRSATIASLYTPIVLLLSAAAAGMVLWRGGSMALGILPGGVATGTLVAFISYAVQFFEPVKQFARVFTELNYTQASAERVMDLLELKSDIKDSDEVENRYGGMLASNRESWPAFHGRITFRNVSFRYQGGDYILENFNLEIRPGEKVAIVGETGAGKTTLVNLACRFYEPTEGEILIDGVDYRERPLLWMYANLGYVLQEPHLFSGSVQENIAYGRCDIPLEAIERAARAVKAHDFIMAMEQGYDTPVGERGSRLSTGQKQLISFARAILADPGLFVLDEATSSVDTETEHMIQEAVQEAMRDRTSLIIAHRLSTIRSADRILVIEKGRIVEAGSHPELLQKKGHYWRLHTSQFLQEKTAVTQRYQP